MATVPLRASIVAHLLPTWRACGPRRHAPALVSRTFCPASAPCASGLGPVRDRIEPNAPNCLAPPGLRPNEARRVSHQSTPRIRRTCPGTPDKPCAPNTFSPESIFAVPESPSTYRNSSGACTPRRRNPVESTWRRLKTRASRAAVSSSSSGCMIRKCGESLPRAHCA